MAKNDKQMFLDKYRLAESLIGQAAAAKGSACDGFRGAEEYCEKIGDDENKSKLRMLRLMRNFMVHTPGGVEFLVSEKAQLDYLDGICKECTSYLDTVSKHLSRPATAACVLTSKAAELAAQMAKKKQIYIGVLDEQKKPIDIVSIFELTEAALMSKATTVKKVIAARKPAELVCVTGNTLLADAPKADVVFCTKDGTPLTACSGILKI